MTSGDPITPPRVRGYLYSVAIIVIGATLLLAVIGGLLYLLGAR